MNKYCTAIIKSGPHKGEICNRFLCGIHSRCFQVDLPDTRSVDWKNTLTGCLFDDIDSYTFVHICNFMRYVDVDKLSRTCKKCFVMTRPILNRPSQYADAVRTYNERGFHFIKILDLFKQYSGPVAIHRIVSKGKGWCDVVINYRPTNDSPIGEKRITREVSESEMHKVYKGYTILYNIVV